MCIKLATFLFLMISCHSLPAMANTGENEKTNWWVKFSQKSLTFKEGDNTEDAVTCKIIGTNLPANHFTWFSRPEASTKSENEMICSNGKCDDISRWREIAIWKETGNASVLTFSNVQMGHRKIYVCRVTTDDFKDDEEGCSNKDACQEAEILLRVQSPLRPLWPALGILAQVVVLAIVILWCDRSSKVNNKTYGKIEAYPQSLPELHNNSHDSQIGSIKNGRKPSENGKNGHSVTIETFGEDKATTSKVGLNAKEEDIPLILNDSETKNSSRAAISSKGSRSVITNGGAMKETNL